VRSVAIMLVLLFVCSQALAKGDRSWPSTTAAMLSKPALVGMQLSANRAYRQGKLPAPVTDCLGDLGELSFADVYEAILIASLTAHEIEAADGFFATNVGANYAKHGLLQVYAAVGEPLPEPLPEFSDDEYRELQRFAATSAGRKLMVDKVLDAAQARAEASERTKALFDGCMGRQ
jgi:hypothetical protein